MRVTIVPADQTVIIDGQAAQFAFSVDANVHAVQWYGDHGFVEYLQGRDREAIAALDPYQGVVDQAVAALAPKLPTLGDRKRQIGDQFLDEALRRARGFVPEWDSPVLIRALLPIRALIPAAHPAHKVFDLYEYLRDTARPQVAAASTMAALAGMDPAAAKPFGAAAPGWPW